MLKANWYNNINMYIVTDTTFLVLVHCCMYLKMYYLWGVQ